jgi:hypothetical protein
VGVSKYSWELADCLLRKTARCSSVWGIESILADQGQVSPALPTPRVALAEISKVLNFKRSFTLSRDLAPKLSGGLAPKL